MVSACMQVNNAASDCYVHQASHLLPLTLEAMTHLPTAAAAATAAAARHVRLLSELQLLLLLQQQSPS
ncbi:hypothetical protein Emag_002834 [Eimeria magna]